MMPILIHLIVFLQTSSDWFTEAARPVLVAQAVFGTIALIGLVAVLRRFLSVEFPAAMKGVNDRLDTLHGDFKSLEAEFRQTLLQVERLKVRVDNLKQRQDTLDDTAIRRRRKEFPSPDDEE